MELILPHKYIKMLLHLEQFSLKMNWRLAERYLHNQGYKKDPHGIGQEGGEK